MPIIGPAIEFLAEHADVFVAIEQAIASGLSKDALIKAIEATMRAASDAEFAAELSKAKP